MNGQNFGEHTNTPDFVDEPDKDTNSPVVNSDPYAEKVPVLAALIQETPMGGPVAAVDPIEAPMGETYKAPAEETIVHEAPMGETITHEAPISTKAGSSAALLNSEESEHFRTRWNEIQGKFVDEPRSAVQQADALVSEVIEQITQMFTNEHSTLDAQWKLGKDVSTEDLRQVLQHYRSFFNRLVV